MIHLMRTSGAAGQEELGTEPAASAVVQASGCVPRLPYVLLYGIEHLMSGKLGQSPSATLAPPTLASSSRSQVPVWPASTVVCLTW